jgi:hypothetical protein
MTNTLPLAFPALDPDPDLDLLDAIRIEIKNRIGSRR